MDQEHNPYAAPMQTGSLQPEDFEGEEIRIRREHIATETSLRSFGFLFYLIGGLLVFSFTVVFVVSMSTGQSRVELTDVLVSIVGAGFGILSIYTGYLIRRLSPMARPFATLLGILGLAAIGIGTILAVYLLFLLWCKKGSMVLSERYQEIRRLTPHVKYKTPLYVWIIALLFIGFVVWALATPIFFGSF